jgi:CHAT domain-containing protein/tetratricopeptide (TPR) repeat protein
MQRARDRRDRRGGDNGRLPTLVLLLAIGLGVSARIGHAQATPRATAITQALDAGAYARADDLATRWVALVESQRQRDPLTVPHAQDLLVEARVRNGKGAAGSTLTIAEAVVRAKEQQRGRDHLETAESLHNLGLVRVARGELSQAIPLFERALTIRRASAGADSPLVADTLDSLVFVLIQLERFKEARARLDASMRIREARAKPDEIGLSRTLELVGTLYRYSGPYADAVPPLDRALGIRQRLTPQHPDTASLLQVRGDVLFLRGDAAGAQKVWSSALDMAERTLGPTHPAIAEFLRRLGFGAFSAGNLADARRLRERAFRIGEMTLAPCDPAVTRLMNSLAESFRYDGEFFDARRLYGQALSTIEKCLGKHHSEYATYIFNDAAVAREIGDLAEADALLERALQIWTDVLGPNHAYVARGLDALAEVAALRGQLERSRGLYERALAILRRELGPSHPQVAWMLTNLARTQADQGNTSLAIRYVDQAVAIFRRSGSSDEPDHVARVLELRGTLQMRLGDLTRARASLAEALAERERIFGRAHPLAAGTRATLAFVDLARGHTDTALTAALDAEQIGRDHLRFTVRYLPERQAMAYAAKRPRGRDLALSITASAVPADTSRVFDSVIRSRGVVLDELAARRLASYSANPQGGAVNAAAIAARQRFANLVVRSLQEPVPKAILDDARKQKEDAERVLAERTSEGRAELATATSGVEDVKRALPRGSVLVSFVRFERTTPTRTAPSMAQVAVPHYGAFVVKPGVGRAVFVPLGPASVLEPLVTAWRKVATGEGISPWMAKDRAEALYRSAADRLRATMWDPVETEVGRARQVFVVPDGMLNLVNIGALSDREGRYLAERDAVVHYISTERDVVVFAADATSRDLKSRGGSLLAVGNPAFDDLGNPPARSQPSTRRSGCDAAGPPRFGNLPGSLGEVTEISRIWPASGSSLVTVLSGSTASETAVKKALTGRRVVHFATHGFFLGDACAGESASPTRGTSMAAVRFAEEGRENPLLLTGLALAGANRRSAARLDEDDGILTGEEVASLNLNGVEWAVLSACDTGLGEIRAGEGVFGLRRAFQVAGARTVIMSLWSVDDQATRAWMRALYDARFRRGLSTADAVHTASVTVLRDRRAKGQSTLPFYWAAFVAAGDWR